MEQRYNRSCLSLALVALTAPVTSVYHVEVFLDEGRSGDSAGVGTEATRITAWAENHAVGIVQGAFLTSTYSIIVY